VRWIFSYGLHYVYLSTCRPSNLMNVVTQHPKGWPDALAIG
jgi:hypothetical protein